MPYNVPSEVIGVSEIADNTMVRFIVVRQMGADHREKLVLKAGDGVSFKVMQGCSVLSK
jgi:hypothetical protein